MPDLPPQNRAQRRAQAKGKTPTKSPVFLRRTATKSQTPNAPLSLPISTGAVSEADDPMAAQPESGEEGISTPDVAPIRGRPPASASHKKGGAKQQLMYERLVAIHGVGAVIIGKRNMAAGVAVAERGEKAAEAWMNVGRINPAVMRVLESITLYGPYVELGMVYVDMGMTIVQANGKDPLDLLNPLAGIRRGPTGATRTESPSVASSSETPSPLPYVPVGATAPTEPTPPPLVPQMDSELVVWPDEGLPSDVEVGLRQMARATGRPYEELRQEAVVAIAQMRMEANGNSHTRQAGALGAPIAKE